ncbi:unnamed protein product [Lasius platythorax]|uniref:Uncharacterized protein n=1 Tax=Lasius platythorax TaxID=488582 RepID=A0AAV2PAI8_9HYME
MPEWNVRFLWSKSAARMVHKGSSPRGGNGDVYGKAHTFFDVETPAFTDITEIPTRTQAFAPGMCIANRATDENEDAGWCCNGGGQGKRETHRYIRLNGEIFARDFRCSIGVAVSRIAAFLSIPTKCRTGKHSRTAIHAIEYNSRS